MRIFDQRRRQIFDQSNVLEKLNQALFLCCKSMKSTMDIHATTRIAKTRHEKKISNYAARAIGTLLIIGSAAEKWDRFDTQQHVNDEA